MSRLQLALNVSDLDESVAFYRALFGTEPAKRRPGYANFAIEDPPLKLVLFESGAPAGTINHLGVEVATSDAVGATAERVAGSGLAPTPEREVSCCYARQDKVWVDGPDGAAWEIYAVLSDVEPTADACGAGVCEPAPSGHCC